MQWVGEGEGEGGRPTSTRVRGNCGQPDEGVSQGGGVGGVGRGGAQWGSAGHTGCGWRVGKGGQF